MTVWARHASEIELALGAVAEAVKPVIRPVADALETSLPVLAPYGGGAAFMVGMLGNLSSLSVRDVILHPKEAVRKSVTTIKDRLHQLSEDVIGLADAFE